jgi:glutamate/tyrosine decarboxylase-like PLP-dependent enzyme
MFRITAPVSSNIVCFQYRPDGLSEEQVERLNGDILQRLWAETSPFTITDTTIKGRYMLRVCNVNHRSRYKDFDWLVAEVKKLGDQLLPEVAGK